MTTIPMSDNEIRSHLRRERVALTRELIAAKARLRAEAAAVQRLEKRLVEVSDGEAILDGAA